MRDLALTLDCGTKGVRAVIYDARGNELAKTEKEYEGYYSKEPGYVEAPGAMFWDDAVEVILALKEGEPELFQQISGVTVACQRDTATIIDGGGNPLRDFIIWKDRRVLEEPIPIPQPWRTLFSLIGKREFAESFDKGTHAHWIKIHEPELWERAEAYVLLSGFLITKLTGKIMDARANIAGHLPFDFKKKEWCSPHEIKRQIIQIEREKLCELTGSCAIIGAVTKEAAQITGLREGLPVIGSGTDKGCETIGVGCVNPHIASVSLGTQATVETTVDRYFELVTFYPPFPSVDPEAYNPEITVYSGFWMINWFVENFAQLEKIVCEASGDSIQTFLDDHLKDIPVGSRGLMLQPYWGMESFKPEAMGSIVGFQEYQDKFCIYRAIIEGLGYALKEGLDRIEKKTGVTIDSIGFSGGGAGSDPVCQIMTDIFGKETYRVQTTQTTGLGGAMAIFVALGIYKDLSEAGTKMVHKTKRFLPNAVNNETYQQLYRRVYLKAYKRYKPLYQALKRI